MPFRKSTNSPTPSSSSTPKSSSSPSKSCRFLPDFSFFRSRRTSRPQRRLTRQRNFRYLSDLEFPPLESDSPNSHPSVSANVHSPSHRGLLSNARLLPLPLPDLSALHKKEESTLSTSPQSNLTDFTFCRLPSPHDVSTSRKSSGDAAGERAVSTSPTWRPSFQSPLNRGKKAIGESVQQIQSDFRQKVPANNFPISAFSSPARSPQRMSTGDIFPSPFMSYQGPQAWSAPEVLVGSAPEFPATDIQLFAHTSPEKFVTGQKSKNLSGTASLLHSKKSPESSAAWNDNVGTVAVHPLPLPPVAMMPSSPAFVHQPAVKSEVSSMRSQWKKGKLIGSGSFGNVYVATNRETGALCAMKEVNLIPDDPKSVESMQQLEQEIKVLSQLKHQNIVQYYGTETVEGHFYIYLEYVHPGSINKYIRDHCGSMTESVVRNFTRHILSGLAYLHSRKIIHRDIKAANLLVDSAGVVKLADFGMAKHLSRRASALSMKGSPHWMAPEVMQGTMLKDDGYDAAVDIWSLGCTIIEMITGKPPWSELEGAAAMFKVLRNESPSIPDTLSVEGQNCLHFCFTRNPADRPSAVKLLEHPFVKNSHHPDVHGCTQAISQMKLMDSSTGYDPDSKRAG